MDFERFFLSPETDGGGSVENVETGTTKEQERTYTQEEVDEMLKERFSQEQVDELVKSRVAREKKRAEEEKAEAERLASLSEKERAKEELRLKDEEIAKLNLQIRKSMLEADTIDRLNDEGLPLEFKTFLMADDEENTNENIKNFKKIYTEAIKKEVEERFKGKTPKATAEPQDLDVWEKINNRYKRG